MIELSLCVVFGNVGRTATSSDVKNRYRELTGINLRHCFQAFSEYCEDRSGWFKSATRSASKRRFWKKYFQNSILNDRSTKRDFVSFFYPFSATEFQKVLMIKPNIVGTWDLVGFILNPLGIFTKNVKTLDDRLIPEILYLWGHKRQISIWYKMLNPPHMSMRFTPCMHLGPQITNI